LRGELTPRKVIIYLISATTTPKSDTPSIRAQAIIIAVWILFIGLAMPQHHEK
jgi:hypothetical protein